MAINISKKTKRIILYSLLVLLVLAIGVVFIANMQVSRAAEGRCYNSTDEIPYRRVALLLGTSRLGPHGKPNVYFVNRIEACAKLYQAGRISKVLVSGDNSRKEYNEPEDMRQALIAAGVPDSCIVLDYAGFRTYDSMVRAKKVFGLDSLTIISQQWHNERALYIASRVGIDAVAFNADDIKSRSTRSRIAVREWLARTKMFFDLLLMRDPHFLGDPIEI